MLDFARLYEDHFTTVYRICLARFRQRDFAMEITQEAFARAYAKQGDLRDKASFLPWVTAIAVNYGYRQAKLNSLRFNPLPPADRTGYRRSAGVHPNIADSPFGAEGSFIRRWVMSLKEADQRLFIMKYYYRMRNADISIEMDKPLGTVKRRISHLKTKLKEALHGEKRY